MDEFQKKLIEMKRRVPDCTASRQRLRSVMSDFFPGEKRRINAILNAYDEDIEVRLGNSSDKTLTALQLVKVLKDDYGLADDNAVEAISAWCFIMGLDKIADALGNISPASGAGNQGNPSGGTKPLNGQTYKLGLGVYRAGTDFPAGRIHLKLTEKSKLGINYGIGKNPNRINDDKDFRDQTYIDIEEGQFLKLYCFETDSDYTILATKAE